MKLEQKRVRLRVKLQEKELRTRVKKVPGELVASVAKTVVPAFIAGKVTDTAIGGLSNGINMLFSKNKSGVGGVVTGLAGGLAKGFIQRVGVFTALRMASKLFFSKKSNKKEK